MDLINQNDFTIFKKLHLNVWFHSLSERASSFIHINYGVTSGNTVTEYPLADDVHASKPNLVVIVVVLLAIFILLLVVAFGLMFFRRRRSHDKQCKYLSLCFHCFVSNFLSIMRNNPFRVSLRYFCLLYFLPWAIHVISQLCTRACT